MGNIGKTVSKVTGWAMGHMVSGFSSRLKQKINTITKNVAVTCTKKRGPSTKQIHIEKVKKTP
jgi:hypothetical protein